MKLAITSDSVIDLTKELLEKYEIKTIPFSEWERIVRSVI